LFITEGLPTLHMSLLNDFIIKEKHREPSFTEASCASMNQFDGQRFREVT
jgi:hypothetical protein